MAEPSSVLDAADSSLSSLLEHKPAAAVDIRALKLRHAVHCRAYYSLAALSRRRVLDDSYRAEAFSKLFRLRSVLENAIIADLECCGLRDDILNVWASRSFFGVSAKQGVSVRYALASCVPTRTCGGRCYGHDGRDRELHHLFRGALNYFIGQQYAALEKRQASELFERLSDAIYFGVAAAREDRDNASKHGFDRVARIRFSHLGEMAATPAFTNELAREIHQLDESIACVIYTRHPMARELDATQLVINFTLEGDDDTRAAWVPEGSRVVASAWDGQLSAIAEVNFLEHHVEKVQPAVGLGGICPVTADHTTKTSCDAARCQLCFVSPRLGAGQAHRSSVDLPSPTVLDRK
jgi:hypothetical protein